MAANPPLLFSARGPVATPPLALQEALLALVAAEVPGYTATLPGSLIEDVSSTDVGALVTVDQARVESVNNVSPYSANPYILAQFGAMFGVPQGLMTNGSVLVVFSGSPGYVIPPGFIVSDGTNQYAIQDGGAIASGGTSQPLFCVATNSNTFAIPPGSVTTIITSVPSPFTLTVTNPLAGVPAEAPETTEIYRSRILTAFQVAISGTPTYLKTLLYKVPGVAARLVSVRQSGVFWEVICGGGDPFQVAGAIYQGVSTVGLLTGSATGVRNIVVSVFDAPDTYTVPYVNPPQQETTVSVLWNTTLANFTASEAVNQFIVGAVQAYVNSIVVGQPINLLVMTEQIQAAVAPVLDPSNLTTLQFSVTVDGVLTPPSAGTSIIPTDPESYFFVSATGVTSVKG
jgi:hypothetical protein